VLFLHDPPLSPLDDIDLALYVKILRETSH